MPRASLGQGPLLQSHSNPQGDSPQPLTLTSQLGRPDGFSPWASEALRRGERSWGTRIPGSLRTLDWLSYFPTPLVQPQAKALASCKLSSKKTGREPEAGVGVGVGGGQKGERSKGEGWPAKVGRVPGLSITLAGGVTAWSSTSLTPRCYTWRGLARSLSGSPAEPRGGGLQAWGGVALCACVSGPYLFSPPLILFPPAAPHTKPYSPNPQGVGKGGQLYSAAPFRASYPSSSAGSSRQCWPWCPQPCTGHCRRSAPGKSSSLLFLPMPGPVPSTFWFLGGGHTLAGALGH